MPDENIFSGLKVVDLASFIAGPSAATILSDFGADVIKIEPPGGIFCPILHSSPPGGSILMTSAPKSERIVAALGPAMKLARSTTFSPENMFSSGMSFLLSSSDREFQNKARTRPALASLELRSTLRKEGRCSFLLVFGPGANREQRSFQEEAPREARV